METLGTRIAQLRREHKMKQDDLANALGLSPQAISKWENDQTSPDISVLPQLAALLHVSVDVLLSGEQAAPPPVQLLPPEQCKDISQRILRIVIDSSDNDKVRINLPMGLIPIALEMGATMPQISNNPALQGIDFQKIIELVEQGFSGNLIDIESSDGDIIHIFVD